MIHRQILNFPKSRNDNISSIPTDTFFSGNVASLGPQPSFCASQTKAKVFNTEAKGENTFVSVCEFSNRRRLCSHYEIVVLRPGSAATLGLLFHPLTSLSGNSNST